MPAVISNLVERYVGRLCKIYGEHLKTVILYGSYARGDYTEDSDFLLAQETDYMNSSKITRLKRNGS